MSDNFLGEIKLLPYDWPPKGWAPCDGRQLAIATNQALFSLLGTTFGGNGVTTFALPDLRGRVPLHPNLAAGIPQGALAGVENVTLLVSNLPAHNHNVSAATTQGDSQTFANNYIAGGKGSSGDVNLYEAPNNLQPLNPGSISNTGGSLP
ncbi:MAG TPA: tail fiber protein, partial [Cellvibrio sp.]|nr:tail fiber protein [Cellvibrio sp.]